ncbi:MAG: hypothetical protein ACF8PN_13395 [Phycisphaerales bacterium]
MGAQLRIPLVAIFIVNALLGCSASGILGTDIHEPPSLSMVVAHDLVITNNRLRHANIEFDGSGDESPVEIVRKYVEKLVGDGWTLGEMDTADNRAAARLTRDDRMLRFVVERTSDAERPLVGVLEVESTW